jgi:hypothetical protein
LIFAGSSDVPLSPSGSAQGAARAELSGNPRPQEPATAPLAREPSPAASTVVAETRTDQQVASAAGVAPPPVREQGKPAPKRAPRSMREPAVSGGSHLLAEVARLDQARAALAASDAPQVLHQIERYRSEFPDGVLAREAARIEARALESRSSVSARDIEEAR